MNATPRTSSARKNAPRTSQLRAALVELAPDLYARALRLARNPTVAEDVVQDTMERAMRFESHFIVGTNARAWLFQILFSVFITRCRRARREQRALGVLATDPCAWTLPESMPVMNDLTPALKSELEQLPESFKRALELVDLQEMSYKDAADTMGVPVGTVMSRLHRGRKLLSSALRAESPAAASVQLAA
jgi:RNA polymerase sigma-70 factor (ECF subfamily)